MTRELDCPLLKLEKPCLTDIDGGVEYFNQGKYEIALEFFQKRMNSLLPLKIIGYCVAFGCGYGTTLNAVPWSMQRYTDPINRGMAHCYYRMGKYKESLNHFNKIFNTASLDIFLKAWCYYKLGNDKKAKSLFEECQLENPYFNEIVIPYKTKYNSD